MIRRRAIGLLLLLLALGACAPQYTFRGTAIDPPEAAPDFTLADTNGQPFHLAAQDRMTLLYFGYTHCPDACPLALAHLAEARRALGEQAEQVQVVMVTVDPARDTPEVLNSYLSRFDPSIIGLRGTPQELAPILKAYHAEATMQEASGGESTGHVDHSAYIYVIDRTGRWRVLFNPDTPPADIASDLQHLISN